MRVDAHQHFWLLADREGQWPPASLATIHRDFMPHDLLPTLQRAGVEATVLVQSLPSVADTVFLLQLADRHPFVRGVVGWVDLKATDAVEQIDRLARHPRLRGLRPMLQDLSDSAWIADPALDAAVEVMLAHRLCFDALVLPRQLSALTWFARRHPGLPIVIDHAAKPHITTGELEPWLADMSALAALPQVHCKLSGLLTEAGPSPDAERLQPCVQAIYRLFGSERLLWGSDWPVLRLAGSYDAWLAMARRLCKAQGADDAAMSAIFGGNAQRFYRLD
jgi:L-fuconolactonase